MAATTEDLSTWLVERAGVSPKFLGAVLATCDEQMIGTVDNLAMLQSGGQLGSVFKPVIAASIESALSGGGASAAGSAAVGAVGTVSAGSANGAGVAALSFQNVKRQLMVNRQSTWGNEAELRTNLDMFLKQENAKLGNWDSAAQAWANTPAAPADPNKSTFTVTLKTPDGDIVFECPPDQYVLDEAEEQEIEGADGLPYACRAGSCSACTGKIVSGTMDVSGCGFLEADQKAAGFVLTCTAKPTSDVVIETHKEDDLH